MSGLRLALAGYGMEEQVTPVNEDARCLACLLSSGLYHAVDQAQATTNSPMKTHMRASRLVPFE